MSTVGESATRPLSVQYALLRIFRSNWSHLSNCEQTTIYVFGILPLTWHNL